MSFSWDEAVAFALTLPGVVVGAGAKRLDLAPIARQAVDLARPGT